MNGEDIGKMLVAFIICGGLAALILWGQSAAKSRKSRTATTESAEVSK